MLKQPPTFLASSIEFHITKHLPLTREHVSGAGASTWPSNELGSCLQLHARYHRPPLSDRLALSSQPQKAEL